MLGTPDSIFYSPNFYWIFIQIIFLMPSLIVWICPNYPWPMVHGPSISYGEIFLRPLVIIEWRIFPHEITFIMSRLRWISKINYNSQMSVIKHIERRRWSLGDQVSRNSSYYLGITRDQEHSHELLAQLKLFKSNRSIRFSS